MNLENICYLSFGLWGVSEIALGVFRRAPENALIKDSNTFFQYAIIGISISCGMGFAFWSKATGFRTLDFPGETEVWQVIGLASLVVGLTIRWIAILTLGRYFSTNLTVQSEQRVVDFGLYRYIRHPAYTGSILSFFGFGLAMTNWISFIFLTVMTSASFIKRIVFEEEMLSKRFGAEYEEYKKRTKKLFPMVF